MIAKDESAPRPDEANRLVEARIARGFADAKSAAEFFGWNYNTYSQHERGERGLKPAVAEKYAKALRVTRAWLQTGTGQRVASFTVKVMGKIGAGAAILPEFEQISIHGLYEIETSFAIPEGAIAFEIEGDSMWPRYDPGDIIVCWREGSNLNEVIGWEAAVRTQDGMRYLKRIVRGAEPGTVDLESHNAPPIRGVLLEWVAQVHAVVRANMWKKATPAEEKRIIRQIEKAFG